MNESLGRMTERITGIMDQCVHSIWLYGSIVMDDYRQGWSDIDLLVLTNRPISDREARELLMLRQTMAAADPGNRF